MHGACVASLWRAFVPVPEAFWPATTTNATCREQTLRTTNQTCKGYCHGGGKGWADSFAVNTATHGMVCYCKTTFDHGIGNATINTPAGCRNMRQVCQDIEDKYGPAPASGRQYYNSIQCGHPPYNQHVGCPDELPQYCPGRVDDGGKGTHAWPAVPVFEVVNTMHRVWRRMTLIWSFLLFFWRACRERLPRHWAGV